MSVNSPSDYPSSRPITITVFSLILYVLALGQVCGAGLLPSVNIVGILLGAILFVAGIAIWLVKRLWRKEWLVAYLNFLASAMFLIVAINGALGLGIAEYKVSFLFVGVFVAVGLVFFFLGGSFFVLGAQSRKQ